MTIPIAATGRELQRSNRHAASRETGIWKDYAETKVELAAALLRERELLREKSALLQRQDMLAQEFEHRLLNSLQVIVSLLSLQSRAATTVEAGAQLSIAAERVAAFGRLHLLDHQKSVGFKPYLQHCGPGLRHAEILSIANLILAPQVEQTFGAKKEGVCSVDGILLEADGRGSFTFTFSSSRGELSGRVNVGTEGPPDRRSTADKEQAAKNQILALARELAQVCE